MHYRTMPHLHWNRMSYSVFLSLIFGGAHSQLTICLSNNTGTGLLAAINAVLAFIPFNEEDSKDILTMFDGARHSFLDCTALQQKQYDFQRMWLTAG